MITIFYKRKTYRISSVVAEKHNLINHSLIRSKKIMFNIMNDNVTAALVKNVISKF